MCVCLLVSVKELTYRQVVLRIDGKVYDLVCMMCVCVKVCKVCLLVSVRTIFVKVDQFCSRTT